jgi:putative transposase
MPNGQPKRHRRTIRLQAHDYSQSGAYFVTIGTQERALLFGEIIDGDMRLNDAGRMVEQCWLDIPNHFPHVDLDAFVVMPNHVHGILVITDRAVGAKNFSPLQNTNKPAQRPIGAPSKSIGSIIRGFKIGVTKWVRENTDTHAVWQRNYYEHVIRNEESLLRIRQYILDNPARWAFDGENPEAITPEKKDAWAS